MPLPRQSQKNDGAPAGERNIATFLLRGQTFGIDMKALVEVREWEEPTPLPGAPSWLLGTTNLRGAVMPVFDMSQRLGWDSTTVHPRSCIVVVQVGDERAAFLVDQVADIISVAESAIQPAPAVPLAETGLIDGLVQVAGPDGAAAAEATITLLDLAALNIVVPAARAA